MVLSEKMRLGSLNSSQNIHCFYVELAVFDSSCWVASIFLSNICKRKNQYRYNFIIYYDFNMKYILQTMSWKLIWSLDLFCQVLETLGSGLQLEEIDHSRKILWKYYSLSFFCPTLCLLECCDNDTFLYCIIKTKMEILYHRNEREILNEFIIQAHHSDSWQNVWLLLIINILIFIL